MTHVWCFIHASVVLTPHRRSCISDVRHSYILETSVVGCRYKLGRSKLGLGKVGLGELGSGSLCRGGKLGRDS